MASSNAWAVVGGVVIVAGALGGAALWRHAHPDAPSPLAALAPAGPGVAPASSAPPAPGVAPAPAPPAKPALRPDAAAQVADRGPEPVSAPNPEEPVAPAPTFDIVRVERSGEAVVAGTAHPGADVALMAGGKVVGQAKADDNGQFVMTPPPLSPGNYDLSLRQTEAGRPDQTSVQAVTVAVPQAGKGDVVVALAEPGKATKILSAPAAPPPSAAAPGAPAAAQLGIRTVELENGTGFFATGSSPPGQQVHVYLNGSHLADVTAAADGAWSLRIGKGLTGGHYTVRADAVAPNGTAVASRVEVPFDVPVTMAQAQAPATHATDAPAPPSAPNPQEASAAAPPAATAPAPDSALASANAVVADIETARVVPGDNLWDISRTRFGDGTRYTRIYTANASQIRDPNLIYPGQVFVVPHD